MQIPIDFRHFSNHWNGRKNVYIISLVQVNFHRIEVSHNMRQRSGVSNRPIRNYHRQKKVDRVCKMKEKKLKITDHMFADKIIRKRKRFIRSMNNHVMKIPSTLE